MPWFKKSAPAQAPAAPTFHFQPYLKVARHVSSWFRIRVVMGILLFMAIVELIVSGVQMESYSGGMDQITQVSIVPDPKNSNSTITTVSQLPNWDNVVCESSPIIYVRPFYFHYSYKGTEVSTASYCAWPVSMSAFRLAGSAFFFFLICLLFLQTFLSDRARTIFLAGFLFYFSCFFLDSNHSMVGMQACVNNFSNTILGDFIRANNITISCYQSSYLFTIFLDFFLFASFFLMFEAWGMCPDLYNGKKRLQVKGTGNDPVLDNSNSKPVMRSEPTQTKYSEADAEEGEGEEQEDADEEGGDDAGDAEDKEGRDEESGEKPARRPRRKQQQRRSASETGGKQHKGSFGKVTSSPSRDASPGQGAPAKKAQPKQETSFCFFL